MLNKDKWKLHQFKADQDTKTGLVVDSQAMQKHPGKCQICSKKIVVWIHKDFNGLATFSEAFKSESAGIDSDPTKTQVHSAVMDSTIDAIIGMATCQNCFQTRNQYIKARELMSNVMSNAVMKWDRNKQGWNGEEFEQRILIDKIKDATMVYVQALRALAGSTINAFIDDMWRPFWTRPYAWHYYMNLLDEKIYTGKPIYEDKNFFIAHMNRITNRDPVPLLRPY